MSSRSRRPDPLCRRRPGRTAIAGTIIWMLSDAMPSHQRPLEPPSARYNAQMVVFPRLRLEFSLSVAGRTQSESRSRAAKDDDERDGRCLGRDASCLAFLPLSCSVSGPAASQCPIRYTGARCASRRAIPRSRPPSTTRGELVPLARLMLQSTCISHVDAFLRVRAEHRAPLESQFQLQ